jgi:ribonucleoside-diphosphate reductase alpha chain
MGYMGLGSALSMMCIQYGSDKSVEFTRKVTQVLAYMNYTAGYELAKEKGEAPVLQHMHNVADMPHNFNTNFKGKSAAYKGRTLFLESHYFDNFEGDDEGASILRMMKKYGCRFSHATSIAPTGTIAFGLGNNVSNGIEPSFLNYYLRNRIVAGKATKEQVAMYSYEMLAYKEYVKAGLVKHEGEVTDKNLPEYFSTASTVSVRGHIDIQAAAQEWVDSSISKTVNVPRDISFNDFKEVYAYAHRKGLKGCATYRPNPERFSGVLVRPEEQASTIYEFTTENGDTFSARGDEKIQYRGEEHVAANLYEAINNGYFGKI